MLVNATEMLKKAKAGHYAVGQFNINNLEWTKAILLTAQELNSPVILGVSEGAGKYIQKLLCLHHLQQDFRNCSFPHYKIFLFLCYWFLHINLPVRSLKTFVFTHWIYYHTTQKYARNIFC